MTINAYLVINLTYKSDTLNHLRSARANGMKHSTVSVKNKKQGRPWPPLLSCSSAGTRTQNTSVTLIPAFRQGVDYLIIRVGCRALWDVSVGLLIPSLCTFLVTCYVPFTRLGSGLPPPSRAEVFLNSPDFPLLVAEQRCYLHNSRLLCRLSYRGSLRAALYQKPFGYARPKGFLSSEIIAQLAAAIGMSQLAQRLGLDLADAFACDTEELADLFERVAFAIAQPKAHLQHFAFAIG